MVYKIEVAQSNDAKHMIDYLKQVGSETDFLLFGAEGVSMSVQQESLFLEKMNATPSSRMFVVKVHEKIVANAHIQGHTKPRTKHKASIGISVLKDYWHQGIGSMLLQQLIDYAKTMGSIKTIYLEVISENIRAINLYKKFGFEVYGLDQNSTKVGSKYYDNYLMRLDI